MLLAGCSPAVVLVSEMQSFVRKEGIFRDSYHSEQ